MQTNQQTASIPAARADQPTPLNHGTRALSRLAQWVLLAVPVIIFAWQGWAHRWVTEDAFIDLRVVQQIVQGHGPVFNTGQRVEAFTSPAWVALLTFAYAVFRVRLEWLSVILGIGSSTAGIGFAIVGSRRLLATVGDVGSWLVPTGALVPLALWPVWYFESSGLETGLVFGWLGLSLWVLARWAGRRGRVRAWEAVILGLGWVIRPDVAIFSLMFFAAVLLCQGSERRWRDGATVALQMFALPLLYELFRMGYFASALPNTAIAKEASVAQWSQGWAYFTNSLGPYWIWIPAVALLLGAYVPLLRARSRDERAVQLVALAFLLGGILHALYIIRVGGDYIAARLLLPSVFAFVAPVSVSPIRRKYIPALVVIPWALICALSLREPGVAYVLVGTGNQHPVTVEEQGWWLGPPWHQVYAGSGVYYGQTKIDAKPARSVRLPAAAFWGIGARPYAIGSRLQVVDLLGLANVLDAHFQLIYRGLPGHEKPEPPAWTAALLTAPGSRLAITDFPPPAFFLLRPAPQWPDQATFVRQVTWARAALRCPAIRDLLDRTTQPLTPGAFFSNIWHAIPDTTLRIPPDPKTAYRRFCHPG